MKKNFILIVVIIFSGITFTQYKPAKIDDKQRKELISQLENVLKKVKDNRSMTTDDAKILVFDIGQLDDMVKSMALTPSR